MSRGCQRLLPSSHTLSQTRIITSGNHASARGSHEETLSRPDFYRGRNKQQWKDTFRNSEEKKAVWQRLIEGTIGNKSLPVCCQSKPQMPGQTPRSQQWLGTCLAPRTDWPLLNSTCYRWSRGKTSRHRWMSLPQQHLLFLGYLNKQHSITMEAQNQYTLVNLLSEITRLTWSLSCFPLYNESKEPLIY